MMDVVSRKCQVTGCLKRPWYSYDGVRSVLCAEHKEPGMVGYRPPQKGAAGAEGRESRKRTLAVMSIHHDRQNQPEHDGGADLVPDELESVGLAMGMSEVDGLQEARALGLDGMGGVGVVLGQPRMGEHDLGGGGGLEAASVGHGALDPTGITQADLGDHGLEQRGLEPGGLDVGGGHSAHDMGLQPVLSTHVDHTGSLVSTSDKMFR